MAPGLFMPEAVRLYGAFLVSLREAWYAPLRRGMIRIAVYAH